jgi:hypothetical protein
MTRKRTPRTDPRHTATHEAGHAVIARVLTLMCGGASIRPVGNGRAMIHGPFECEGEWIGRAKWRSGGAVYRARIIAFMAGTEAEIELLDATQGDDGEDRCQITLMTKELYSCDLDRLRMMTRMLVRRHGDGIERVAAALLAEKELSREQVDELTGCSVDDVPDRLPPRFRGWVGSGVPR